MILSIPKFVRYAIITGLFFEHLYASYSLYITIYIPTKVRPTIYIIDTTARTLLITSIAISIAVFDGPPNKFKKPLQNLTEDGELKRKYSYIRILYVFLVLTVLVHNCFMKVFIYGWGYYRYDWTQEVQLVIYSFTLYSFVKVLDDVSNKFSVLNYHLHDIGNVIKTKNRVETGSEWDVNNMILRKQIVKSTQCIAMRYNTLCKSIDQINDRFGSIMIASVMYLIVSKLFSITVTIHFVINRENMTDTISNFFQATMIFILSFVMFVVRQRDILICKAIS